MLFSLNKQSKTTHNLRRVSKIKCILAAFLNKIWKIEQKIRGDLS